MVDTINPQTGKEDEFAPTSTNQAQPQNTFYTGFSKPDDVHVNLAAEHQQASPVPEVAPTTPQAVPAAASHQVYSANQAAKWLPILLVSLGSLVMIILTYFITSMVANSVLQGRLEEEEAKLANLEQEYNNISSSTKPLELPVTTPVTETPSVATPTPPPAVNVPATTAEPIEVPVQPSSSYANGQG